MRKMLWFGSLATMIAFPCFSHALELKEIASLKAADEDVRLAYRDHHIYSVKPPYYDDNTDDYSLKIWDAGTFQLTQDVDLYGTGIGCFGVTKDESLMVTTGYHTQLWDLSRMAFRFLENAPGSRCALGPNDDRFVTEGPDAHAPRIFDLRTGNLLVQLEAAGVQYGLYFSSQGKYVAGHTGQFADYVHLWDAATGKLLGQLNLGSGAGAYNIAFSLDDQRLLVTTRGGVQVWDTSSLKQLMAVSGAADGVEFDPKGRWVAVAGWNGSVSLYSADLTQRLAVSKPARHDLAELHFSPDGNRIVASDIRGTVHVWQVE